MHVNHIKFIDLFMLKLCNLNGWKIIMQLNYIKCTFRPNHFFECIFLSTFFGKKCDNRIFIHVYNILIFVIKKRYLKSVL